jgi:Carbohydrate esterase, sialic acid-specific acetylesterase
MRKQTYKALYANVLVLLGAATAAQGELLVYEPFDYQPVNHEIHGRLEGRNGGRGFAKPWKDSAGASSTAGYAFIYDQRGNPEKLYAGGWGEGKPNWDGVVDNLPTLGGYAGSSDWDLGGTSSLHSTRKLARSAGEMAKANSGVLWLSAVWHMPSQQFFAPVGIALASNEGGFIERAISMGDKADAIGVGNGRKFRERKRLNPIVWNKGEEVAGASGSDVSSKNDNIIMIKFEFGATDKVSTWSFIEGQEMTEAAFSEHAASCSASVDENALDVLAVCGILKDTAIDEIRIGTSFQSVITGTIPARQEVKITKNLYDAASDSYVLEWSSNPGETYGIYFMDTAGGGKVCVTGSVDAAAGKQVTTFGPFKSPRKGNGKLQFELGMGDRTPPTIQRVWGSCTSINLLFSEPMFQSSALTPGNYVVEQVGGNHKVSVSSVRVEPSNGAIQLTLAEPLKSKAEYSVTTRNLTDCANLPLVVGKVSLRTWDDDPKGIKVFILAGQSNMVGYGHDEVGKDGVIGGPGTLRYLAVNASKYPEFNYASLLADPSQPATSAWKTRSDVKVWWRNGANAKLGGPIGKGDLGPPFRGANPKLFGPEFGFGQVIGDYYASDDVLIIKTAWGGHNLVTQFRSPNAVAARGGTIGESYLEIFKNAHEVLDNLGTEFPEWAGRGYQIVGFGWHQGTSDKAPLNVAEEYKHNLPDFIKAVRSEFGKPDLPFVIASAGMGDAGPMKPYPHAGYNPVEIAQLWAAGVEKPANVLSDDTRGYWETVENSPMNQSYHWNQNARSYFRVGLGLGNNMVKLLGKK